MLETSQYFSKYGCKKLNDFNFKLEQTEEI